MVVVGGGAAGASAAARARRLDPNAEVILIERGSMITHAPCGMPYAIGGIVKSHEELMTYKPEEFEKERNIKVLVRSAVVDIDVDKRIVAVKRGGSEEKIQWDKLVIATGAKPLVPKIPGADLKGILTLRHPDEVPDLKGHLEKAKTVAVVGGGYIGVEMADVLLDMGKRVLLFEMFEQVLPASLDPDTAAVVAEEMRGRGAELHLGEKVVEFRGAGHVNKVVTEKGEYQVDEVVLAVDVSPRIQRLLPQLPHHGWAGLFLVGNHSKYVPGLWVLRNHKLASLPRELKQYLRHGERKNLVYIIEGSRAVWSR